MFKYLHDLSSGARLLIAAVLVILIAVTGYFTLKLKSNGRNIAQVEENKSIDRQSLRHGIDSIMSSYGILPEWGRDTYPKGKNANDSSILISKDISIPKDLAAAELNLEITNFLSDNGLTALVTENPGTKSLAMKIYRSNDSLKTQRGFLNLNYSDSVNRNAAEVFIVIDDIETFDPAAADKILKSLNGMSFAVEAGKDNAELMAVIGENKSDYLLMVTAGKNVDADFTDEMSEQQVKTKVRTLSSEFRDASGIIINDDTFRENIAGEFQKYKLEVYTKNKFYKINPEGDRNLNLYDEILSKTKSSKKVQLYLFSLTTSELSGFDQAIYKLKKLGYKFRSFRDYVKKTPESDSLNVVKSKLR